MALRRIPSPPLEYFPSAFDRDSEMPDDACEEMCWDAHYEKEEFERERRAQRTMDLYNRIARPRPVTQKELSLYILRTQQRRAEKARYNQSLCAPDDEEEEHDDN